MTSITLRLIYVNYDGKPVELVSPVSKSFKDLKKQILGEKWPENYVDVAQIERLRLFCSGKELEDHRTVHDLVSIANQAGFAPVHVTTVNKSAKSPGLDRSDPSDASINKCHCCLM